MDDYDPLYEMQFDPPDDPCYGPLYEMQFDPPDDPCYGPLYEMQFDPPDDPCYGPLYEMQFDPPDDPCYGPLSDLEGLDSAFGRLRLKPKNRKTNATAKAQKASTSNASESKPCCSQAKKTLKLDLPAKTTDAVSQIASTSKVFKNNDSRPKYERKCKDTAKADSKLPSCYKKFKIPKHVKVERNDDILIALLTSFSENTDEFTEIIKNGNVYKLKELSPLDTDHRLTKATFSNSMRCARKPRCRLYSVKTIKKVCAPYLVAHFRIRKEKRRQEGHVCEGEVYHGTKHVNVAPICKENYDWRKSGTHVGTKFGRGVSFAKYPTYASFYPKVLEYPRVMLVTKILYVRNQIGRTGMTVPDDNYDTSSNANGEVIVKYDDAEFLALFAIYYS